MSVLTLENYISGATERSSLAGTINPSHVYELSQSDSLTFLYNLLYDDKSCLTKTDILSILRAFKEREVNLPFSLAKREGQTNVQGVFLGPSLRRRFYQERARIGSFSWFSNIPNSRAEAVKVS